ncbi:MAG: DNA topology modulation protein FlaR [Woeseiaceae bacterium]
MKRVMIIGGAGSGKSTLALKLGDVTGLPVIHIDKMYWLPGWVEREREEVHRLAREAAQGERWILDGNNSATMWDRVARADTLIFLDFSTMRRLWRILWRIVVSYGQVRPDMQEDCPEQFDWAFLKFVAGYGKDGRIRTRQFLKKLPDTIDVFHLCKKTEVRNFLRQHEKDDQNSLRRP